MSAFIELLQILKFLAKCMQLQVTTGRKIGLLDALVNEFSKGNDTAVEAKAIDAATRERLMREAEAGADLESTANPLEFLVSGVRVRLTAKTSELLGLLAAESGDDDKLVGWKSTEWLAEQMGVKRHALHQRVLRIRKTLAAHQLNPYLVQSGPDGLRFARRLPSWH
ncbi:MAG: hypothetical protein KBD01_15750 [Acidobacteria bacterium]|nr:hypothetical protein [Acidobacteriota bacterium]